MSVTPADLGTYLSVSTDTARATLILANAVLLCQSVVTPLPAGADAVVLDVAARAYGNPSNITQQTVGPYSANYGAAGGGLWLTRSNRATLRRLAGGGGAFAIDMLPATAGTNLPVWDSGAAGFYNDGYQ